MQLPRKPYEIIEHTADIGLRIYGQSLEDLFAHAAEGLYSLITDIQAIQPKVARTIKLQAPDAPDLLFQWLRELLFVFSTEQFIFTKVVFKRLTEKSLEAVTRGDKFDPRRHEQKSEVKAVTYHQFKLRKENSGWMAEVIFDV